MFGGKKINYKQRTKRSLLDGGKPEQKCLKILKTKGYCIEESGNCHKHKTDNIVKVVNKHLESNNNAAAKVSRIKTTVENGKRIVLLLQIVNYT